MYALGAQRDAQNLNSNSMDADLKQRAFDAMQLDDARGCTGETRNGGAASTDLAETRATKDQAA